MIAAPAMTAASRRPPDISMTTSVRPSPDTAPCARPRGVGRVAMQLAIELGITDAHAQQVLGGRLAERTAAVIRAHVAIGAYTELQRWANPITDEFDRIPGEKLRAELVAEATTLDGVEDGSLAHLMVELKDPIRARHWIRDHYREAAVKQRLARAVCEYHGWNA